MTSIAFTSLFLGLVLGTHTIGVAVEGPVAAVAIELDGKPAGRIATEPWQVPVNFGRELEPHELVARALDPNGKELAHARQWLNVPRPAAEASLLLENDAEGRAVAARLNWQSLLGTAPRRVSVTFDGRPLELRNPARIELPEYSSEGTHLLAVEIEFSPEVVSRAGVVIGGRSRTEATSELTGVPIRVAGSAALPPPEALRGWFRKDGKPLQVIAHEKDPALVLVVRDTDHTEALGKLGSGGKTTFAARGMRGALPQYDPDHSRFETRLGPGDRVRFLWPRATRTPGSTVPTELFDASRDFGDEFAGLHWLLTRVSHPIQKTANAKFADAVAIAGLQAYASYARRAVVLVLGRRIDDASQYEPALVRAYLAKIHVPLHVWSLDNRTAGDVAARWGAVEDVSSFPKLKVAFERLRSDLDSQHMVWLEGRHLPQELELAERARGIELAR